MLEKYLPLISIWFAGHISIFVKTFIAYTGASVETKLSGFRKYNGPKEFHRITFNTGLFILWSITVAAFSAFVIYIVQQTSIVSFGLLRNIELPKILKIIFSLFILDFTNYIVHRLEHKIPIFWKFHKLHHQDTHLDFSTTIRKHPLSGIFTTSCFIVAILVFGISPLSVFIYNIIGDCVGFMAHSNFIFPVSINKFLGAIKIITPNDHRLHHSTLQPETDSNFGQILSFWDHTFKTYKTREDYSNFEYGLKEI